MSEGHGRRVVVAVQDAERKVTESKNQLSKFSRIKTQQDAVTKSLQALQNRLDQELKKVRSTVKDASDISSFITKICSESFQVGGGINELLDTSGLINRLRRNIDPCSSILGPLTNDPYALWEGLRVISQFDAGEDAKRPLEPVVVKSHV